MDIRTRVSNIPVPHGVPCARNILTNFVFRSDVAYFDGLGETILCVGLVKPKPSVFNSFVRCLLVLVTTIEIVILGVTFTSSADGKYIPTLYKFDCQTMTSLIRMRRRPGMKLDGIYRSSNPKSLFKRYIYRGSIHFRILLYFLSNVA